MTPERKAELDSLSETPEQAARWLRVIEAANAKIPARGKMVGGVRMHRTPEEDLEYLRQKARS